MLISSITISLAQEVPFYTWALKFTPRTCTALNDLPALTKSDNAGNVYLLGASCQPFDADPGAGTFTLTPANTNYDDTYLIKLDPQGKFLWATSFADDPYANFAADLIIDGSGNVYALTYYQLGFENYRTIISKFDASGNPVWTNRIYTIKGRGEGITQDASGNLLIAGYFSGAVDFDPGAGVQSISSNGSETDLFILKLTSDGNFVWVKTTGGTGVERAVGLAQDGLNNIVVGGYYTGTTDLDPGASVNSFTSSGGADAFVLKLDDAGNFIWAKSMGGAASDLPTSLAINTSNNIFMTGYFTGSGDFDPNAGVTTLTSTGPTGSDIFLMRLNADGSFGWAHAFGANDSDQGNAITTDADGDLIFTGFFNGTVDFDPGAGVRTLVSIGQNNYQNIFISKLNQNGQLIWAQEIASTTSTSARTRAYTISIDAAGDILIGGSLWGFIDFDFGVCDHALSNNLPAGFVLKIKTGAPTGPPTITSFTPTSGPAGTTVVITGTNFSPVPSENDVRWSPNVAAVVTASTTTTITATVPVAAAFGKLYVTVGCYPTAVSANNFTVGTPVMSTITAFAPSSGQVGTVVTITGTNFSTIPANNAVAFNGTNATVTSSTTTSITTMVPAGATTGKITVTVGGNTTTSAADFIVPVSANQPPIIESITSGTIIGSMVTINILPLISDPDDNLDVSSLSVIDDITQQGASATLNPSSQLVLDYKGVQFAGTDAVTIEVCDLELACTQQQLLVEVAADVAVYNAVSPNNDSRNDIFNIANIDVIEPNNNVTIYNRWGDVVWDGTNYNNTTVVFTGKSNKGNELPSGSYFYKIEFASGRPAITGYLSLKQ